MTFLRKIWNFIWYDDSPLSWIVNIILALVLVKYIIYPVLGLVLGTTHPLVAVVSGSMEHDSIKFEGWWEENKGWYESNNIQIEQFTSFPLRNGFNKGDIMILWRPSSLKVGDVIVFRKQASSDPPVIHRIVFIEANFVQTKGDNVGIVQNFEENIQTSNIVGKAVLRIPFLGYIKIWFIDLLVTPIIRTF